MIISKKILLMIFVYLLTFIVGGTFYMYQQDKDLKVEKYKALSFHMQEIATGLIAEKEKESLLISLAFSDNEKIKQALLTNDANQLSFNHMTNHLSQYIGIENLWVQLINAQGESVYRTWTSKKGDSLLTARLDVASMLQTKKLKSYISTGKFSMAFKAMMPVMDGENFIGIIESIMRFDDLLAILKGKGYEALLLVDKRYKQQLTQAKENMFIEQYFLATSNASHKILERLKMNKIENYITMIDYFIDEQEDLLFTTKHIKSVDGEEMGYLILAYPLSAIDFTFIRAERNKTLFIMCILLIVFLGFLYYIYTVQYKRFIEKQNSVLSKKVKEKTRSLQHKALHDGLTNLPNRILLLKMLQSSLKASKEKSESLYVLFLDLDRFKEINDTYGHTIGDKLLQNVGIRIGDVLRYSDILARVSGDEFVVVLKQTEKEEAIKTLDALMTVMKKPITIENIELFISISIGVSHFPTHGQHAKVLIRQADTAMYQAKKMGKNNYQFYENSMTEIMLKRQEISRDLQKALLNKEFEVYYQPKVNTALKKVVGLESLIRWNHPLRGTLYPSDFIALAEEIGLIIQIDEFVRETAFSQVSQWQSEGIDTGVLSLNISTKQLESKSFLSRLDAAINKVGMNVSSLELEVLENQIIKDIDYGISILQSIKERGIKISIDDFGTGYSSLSYLQKLPVDILKIDRSFTKNLFDDQNGMEIVRTIVTLAKNLGLDVIAEGVETKAHMNCLIQEGCDVMQGYYFAKPMKSNECKKFLLQDVKV